MDVLIEELEGSLWTATLDKGRLEGLEIDPHDEEVRWGSIYWAKIIRFDKALDAAFLDLDGDNQGILYNKDVRIKGKDGKISKGGSEPISKAFKAGKMIAVQAKTASLLRESISDPIIEDKLPRMSMDITLPGRYLIYCTTMEKTAARIKGISRNFPG